MKSFAQVVRTARMKLGIAQDRAARQIGTHKGYLSGIESGKVAPPTPRFSRRLAQLLGLEADFLEALAHAEKAKDPDVRALFVRAVEAKWVVRVEYRQTEARL